jgi:hypothetical protein
MIMPLCDNDELYTFAVAYLRFKYGNLSSALHAGTFEIQHGMGITLFRLFPFQVQLFLFRSHSVIENHTHPNVDSFEVYVNGNLELTKENEIITTSQTMFARPDGASLCNGGMFYIPRGVIHGGTIGTLVDSSGKPSGGSFLSIQFWHRQPMTSIHQNWTDPKGNIHG